MLLSPSLVSPSSIWCVHQGCMNGTLPNSVSMFFYLHSSKNFTFIIWGILRYNTLLSNCNPPSFSLYLVYKLQTVPSYRLKFTQEAECSLKTQIPAIPFLNTYTFLEFIHKSEKKFPNDCRLLCLLRRWDSQKTLVMPSNWTWRN